MSKLTHVIKRSGALVPFNVDRIANAIYRAAVSVGGRDRERAVWLAEQVVSVLEAETAEGEHPGIEQIQDVVEKVLIENGHARVAKAYILYRDERSKQRRELDERSRPSEKVPWAKSWQILDWAISHRLHSIEALNVRLRMGEFAEVVAESEQAYEEQVYEAAGLIAGRGRSIRMVIISGPSSSGKTTTTTKLEQRLRVGGMNFVPLNIDNYFFDLEMHPKDEFGDYDFETPDALDLELINNHLHRLIAGEEVSIPFYDFKSGKRMMDQTPLRLGENEILLIDSLHGLYPRMTEGIEDSRKIRLYLEPLLQMKDASGEYIRWTDIRLIRRMLRDAEHRAYDPRMTLEHWHYVRASEMRNIIPYLGTADYIINSAMPYEIALYRYRLGAEFAQWTQDYADDPLRVDAFTRASRVHAFLSQVDAVDDDSAVPDESVLREFIGGSTLD